MERLLKLDRTATALQTIRVRSCCDESCFESFNVAREIRKYEAQHPTIKFSLRNVPADTIVPLTANSLETLQLVKPIVSPAPRHAAQQHRHRRSRGRSHHHSLRIRRLLREEWLA